MRVFIISDTHFGHDQLVDLNVRPKGFSSRIIKRWNMLLREDDLLIHLGDLSFLPNSNTKEVLDSLRGRKVLVLGNHDKNSLHWYMNNGFEFACKSFSWEYMGLKILFTHEPADHDGYDVNIHGHLHEGRHRTEYILKHSHLLFSLESLGYEPISLKTFLERPG